MHVLLTVKYKFYVHRITKAEVQPFLEDMLSNLLNLLQVPGSQENEYVMKGMWLDTISETLLENPRLVAIFFWWFVIAVWFLACVACGFWVASTVKSRLISIRLTLGLHLNWHLLMFSGQSVNSWQSVDWLMYWMTLNGMSTLHWLVTGWVWTEVKVNEHDGVLLL